MKKFLSNLMFPLVLLGVVCGLASCSEPRIPSPDTGKMVTSDELFMEKLRAEQEAKRQADADAAESATALRKLRAETSAEAIKITSSAEIATVDARAALALLAANAEGRVQDIIAAAEARTAAFATASADREAKYAAAETVLAAEREKRLGLIGAVSNLPIVGQVLASAGVSKDAANTGLSALFGLGLPALAWYGRSKIHAAADKGWDESQAAEKKQQEDKAKAEALAWAESQVETLRVMAARLPATALPPANPALEQKLDRALASLEAGLAKLNASKGAAA